MDRRSFIKLTAISGTSAALASCGSPENQLIRFVPDEDIVPGQAVWKPSVCPLCAAGCGLTVRVMDAEADVMRNGQAGIVQIFAAKKLEGSPAYPVNHGALCARGQAAIQVTYHPDRITQPLERSGNRGDGRYSAISWDDAIKELVSRLDGLEGAGQQKGLAYLTRSGGGHRAALVGRFLAAFGASGPTTHDLFGDEVLRRANALSFGRDQLPTFDLPNAQYVIVFGADFLGTWNSPVSQSVGYGLMRQGRRGIRGSFVQVESRMSQTGANADEWVPARPGTEGILALGLANVIMSAKLRPTGGAGKAGALIDGWNAGLAEYSPEQVEKLTGVAARRVERLAHELAERRPSVAIIGGPPLAHTNGLVSALAVNALNALLGSVEQPGGIYFTPQPKDVGAADVAAKVGAAFRRPGVFRLQPEGDGAYIADAQAVIVDSVNPVFTTPRAWKLREALEKVPFIASVGSFLDETSVLSDLILPDHSFLESWAEAVPESGSMVAVAGVAPAVMKPLHDTRATPDVLLEVSRLLARPLNLPWQTFEEMLTASFATFPAASQDSDSWTEAQEKGGWWGTLPAALAATPALSGVAAARTFAWSEPQFDGDAQQYPLHFLPYPSSAFLDGSLAHLPWLQEMPDPMTSAMWSSWVEINPATAAKLGIGDGDVVEIASAHGSLQVAAVVSPGIAPDIVAMPAGQGHRTFTRYASGRGASPVELIAPVVEAATGALAWAATRVKISRISGPDGRLILFAGGSREEEERGR
ncbi:MAG TPA: molybdopterin-dependent oxidoreductase [Vicinamibacterales bacterium]|nr:molybdopterin-dependent oxidoreductase [Vicinamibacterales bacterium]